MNDWINAWLAHPVQDHLLIIEMLLFMIFLAIPTSCVRKEK